MEPGGLRLELGAFSVSGSGVSVDTNWDMAGTKVTVAETW